MDVKRLLEQVGDVPLSSLISELANNNNSTMSQRMTEKMANMGIALLPIKRNGRTTLQLVNSRMTLKDFMKQLADTKTIEDSVHKVVENEIWGTDPEFQIKDQDGERIPASEQQILYNYDFLDGMSSTGEYRNKKPVPKKDLLKLLADFTCTFFPRLEKKGWEVIVGMGEFDYGCGTHVHFEIPPWFDLNDIKCVTQHLDNMNVSLFYEMSGTTTIREDHGYGLRGSGEIRNERPCVWEYRRFPSLLGSPTLYGMVLYACSILRAALIDGTWRSITSWKRVVSDAMDKLYGDFPCLLAFKDRYNDMIDKPKSVDISALRMDEWELIGDVYQVPGEGSNLIPNVNFNGQMFQSINYGDEENFWIRFLREWDLQKVKIQALRDDRRASFVRLNIGCFFYFNKDGLIEYVDVHNVNQEQIFRDIYNIGDYGMFGGEQIHIAVKSIEEYDLIKTLLPDILSRFFKKKEQSDYSIIKIRNVEKKIKTEMYQNV